jgi:hypothetical protein
MNRRVIEAGRIKYTISPDDDPPLAQRWWAVARAQLLDEITAEPPRGEVFIGAELPGLIPRVAEDGLVGVAGIPRQLFPNLAAQAYSFRLAVWAEGFIRRRETVTMAARPSFPADFAPTDLGTLLLHREPITIRGRVALANDLITTPVGSAVVSLTGIWRHFPLANTAVPAAPPHIVSLQPPLSFPRPPAAGVLRRRELIPVVGQDKHLLEEVAPGGNRLMLSNRINLGPGDVLLIAENNPDRREYLTVAAVAGAGAADQPATVTATHGVAYAHHLHAAILRVVPQPPGADNLLDGEAIAGDTVVFLDGMTNLSAATVVEVSGGGQPEEYHIMRRFVAITDNDGFFRLPPLSRLALVEIEAVDGVHTAVSRIVSPDYALRENHVDLIFH